MKKQLITLVGILSLSISTAWASPTAQLGGGRTTVNLNPDFVAALVSLGVTPSPITPGTLNLKRGTISYPIPGGVIDTSSLKGDIYHNGGLGLEVPGTKVSLLNFIISTTDTPVLTGVAAVNNDVVDRIPLFDLDLSAASVDVTRWGVLKIDNVGVTLTAPAADTLNAVFNVSAFYQGFPIGTAYLRTRAFVLDEDLE